MKPLHLLSTFLVLATPLSHAQERAAGSTLETQMTWSALSNQIGVVKSQINGVDSKVTVLDNRVSKLEDCGDQQMVYDKSAQTCVKAAAPTCRLEGIEGNRFSESPGMNSGDIACGRSGSMQGYSVYFPTSGARSTNSNGDGYTERGYCLRIVCN